MRPLWFLLLALKLCWNIVTDDLTRCGLLHYAWLLSGVKNTESIKTLLQTLWCSLILINPLKYVPFARIAFPESGINDTKGLLCMSAMILNFEEVGCQIGGLANNIKYPISYKCPASLAAERFLQEEPTLPSSSSFPTAAANLAVKEKKTGKQPKQTNQSSSPNM